ncbi:hypothetical protein [Brevibacillus laterosporus]|uniref:hypothetical protein n=1 Tax=Brevibacillus laterosporus TaxID=1465 RepID=UPI0026543CAD|nr:hypothetical protein [Brevibacillus laterosporus]MDN9012628.1 hypothetical protein [Brevibacillus laterosporus]MDO0943716.1 hypothetical protein [Brevibacillus laterosporus]
MKKYLFSIVSVAFLVMTTGCTGFYNAIEKDTVMVKKINNEHKSNEVEYEGALSQDAMRMLSVNAVNKYFNEKLTVDDVQFELSVIDQNKLKNLVEKVFKGLNPEVSEHVEKELNKIPSGLYYMTLTVSTGTKDIYDIILNARDGDVLKILKVNGANFFGDTSPGRNLFELADQFIQEKGGSELASDLTLDQDAVRVGIKTEVYYKSKTNKAWKYNVMINQRTMKVIGFNKDIMAMLNYYSGSTSYR